MAVETVELEDDAAILAVLEQDRRWSAYALCDLDPPFRARARFIGAVGDGHARAVVLVYPLVSVTSLIPCGEPAGVAAILSAARDLPASIFLAVRGGDLPALETRYRVERVWTMLRMVVRASDLRPAPAVDADIVPLNSHDLPALQRHYALWGDTFFEPAMLESGVYFGAYKGGELVAAAGTHTVSARRRIATIGNVFTHPAHRGRGLATAATGAVAQALVRTGMPEVILNVAEDNTPAFAAYRRLGFAVYEPYWEGHASLRQVAGS